MLLASSGMLPDACARIARATNSCARDHEPLQPAGWQQANQSEQNARAPQ